MGSGMGLPRGQTGVSVHFYAYLMQLSDNAALKNSRGGVRTHCGAHPGTVVTPPAFGQGGSLILRAVGSVFISARLQCLRCLYCCGRLTRGSCCASLMPAWCLFLRRLWRSAACCLCCWEYQCVAGDVVHVRASVARCWTRWVRTMRRSHGALVMWARSRSESSLGMACAM